MARNIPVDYAYEPHVNVFSIVKHCRASTSTRL